MRDAPAAIDLFSGCGGLSAGLRAAGFRILAGLDIEPHAMDTFRLNFPEAYAAECDLAVPDPPGLMERAGLRAGELGLLAGGPPCQGFSKNVPRSRRTADAASNRLVRSFLAYAVALRPRAVLMEKVAEMRKGFGGAWTREVRETLAAAGYRVLHATLDAADYGVPQHRRRAFFAAVRDGAGFRFPEPTHRGGPRPGGIPHVTVGEAIGDLPGVEHDSERAEFGYASEPFSNYQRAIRAGSSGVLNHRPRRLSAIQHERLASLAPGQGAADLPPRLRVRSGYSGAYGRLSRDMVAPAITRWVFHPGSGRYGHPDDVRTITIREAARLQGFPDTFAFEGSYNQQAGQVGNAVPPILAEALGRSLLEALAA